VAVGTASPVEVLAESKTVAVVGASRSPDKEAHSVPLYLKGKGYLIIPVNPSASEVFGEKSYPSLLDIPDRLARTIDIVEVFRPSEELPKVARQVVELKRRTRRAVTFWAQQGLENDEAKRILENGEVRYVMDACMSTVHQVYVRKTASASRRA